MSKYLLVYTNPKTDTKIQCYFDSFGGNCGIARLWSFESQKLYDANDELRTDVLFDFSKQLLNIELAVSKKRIELKVWDTEKNKFVPCSFYSSGINILSKSKLLISDRMEGYFHKLVEHSDGIWTPCGEWVRNSNSTNLIRVWELNRNGVTLEKNHQKHLLD